jgi:phosphonate transport system substrate-binding protein
MFKCFLFIGVLFTLSAGAETKPITIGMLPGGNPVSIEKESYLLAEKLQNKLQKPVQIYISKNYSGMIEALKNKKVDLAILSSMTYVLAEKEADVKVLLKKTWSNGPFYYSAIMTRADSKIKSLKDLKNKKMAYVDENSTSGYLYPQVYLRKHKFDDKIFSSTTFSGNHAASVELLESGKVDAIAVFADDEKAKLGAWTRFAKSQKFKVRVLWVSEPIPNDPIVVRQDFYDQNTKLTHEIMYNLIEMQSESKASLSEILGTSDLMPATSRQYDPVREMVKTFQAVLKL